MEGRRDRGSGMNDEHAATILAGVEVWLAAGPGPLAPLRALEAAVTGVPVRLLPSVDIVLRSYVSGLHANRWPTLTPAELDRFQRMPEAWAVMAAAACHFNGYVRQRAVEALAARGAGRALPVLFVRLNDWVSDVRVAAHAALQRFLNPSFARQLLDALPLVLAVSSQRRANHGGVVAQTFDVLRSPDCTVAVRAGCGAADRTVRRSCFDIELTAGYRRPDLVLDEALSDRDPGVRLWAARRLADAVSQPWAAPVASRPLAARTVQVRRVTLAALAPSLPEERARDLLERALLDTNAGARWQARSLLLARGPFDFAALYRRSLATAARGRAQRGALLG